MAATVATGCFMLSSSRTWWLVVVIRWASFGAWAWANWVVLVDLVLEMACRATLVVPVVPVVLTLGLWPLVLALASQWVLVPWILCLLFCG